MEFRKALTSYNPFSILTHQVKNGVPLFFKQEFLSYTVNPDTDYAFSISIHDSSGVPVDPSVYKVIMTPEDSCLRVYHNLISTRNMFYVITYTAFPEAMAIITKKPLDAHLVLKPFIDYTTSYASGLYTYTLSEAYDPETEVYVRTSPLQSTLYTYLVDNQDFCERIPVIPAVQYGNNDYQVPFSRYMHVKPERLEKGVYYVNTQFLEHIDPIPQANLTYNNLGIVLSDIDLTYLGCRFSGYGKIYENVDFRQSGAISETIAFETFTMAPKLQASNLFEQEYSENAGGYDDKVYDTESSFSAGMVTLLYENSPLLKQLLTGDTPIAALFKKQGILELYTDYGLNPIEECGSPELLYDTLNIAESAHGAKDSVSSEHMSMTDHLSTSESSILSEEVLFTETIEIDPPVLDLFVLDRSLVS